MKIFDYLIIGGGIAGTTACQEIRKNDPTGTIGIISDEPHRLYSRIMLSKTAWFLEKIPFDTIWLKANDWYTENDIELIAGQKATELDPKKQIITLADSSKIGFKKLLLATGSCAREWPLSNKGSKHIYNLRNLDDGKKILTASRKCNKFVAIGGGFISFEIADLMKKKGADVTLIIREPFFWSKILPQEASRAIETAIETMGIRLIKEMEVTEILGDKKIQGVLLANGEKIPCDMIVYGIGVSCENQWLERAGIKTNHGIITDEFLQTNLPNIWAIGDVSEYKDLILDQTSYSPNWINAQKQGQTAGQNMTGNTNPFKFISYYTSKGFDTTVAFIGDARPNDDRTMISRISASKNSYGRIIIKNDKIIGASLINRNQELLPLQKIIEQKIDISEKKKHLADPNFDLNLLLHDQ